MKIAFVGKGGSGKTTISALASRWLAAQGNPVLALDADINQHLGRSLGMSDEEASSLPALGLEVGRVKEYLRGTNPRIPDAASMIKTTPPGPGSRFLGVAGTNPLYDYFSHVTEGVRLMAIGAIGEDDVGVRCYHSKTGAAELLLNHLLDGEREYVVVDMTAGADSFASGLFTRFDLTLLVVEPTLKSVGVYRQYERYAKEYGVAIGVVGNKIADAEDLAFVRREVGDALVACFTQSAFVKKSDRGALPPLSELEPENQKALEDIVQAVDARKKDWERFYTQAVEFHIKNAESWANAAAGKNLAAQADPDFVLRPELLAQ